MKRYLRSFSLLLVAGLLASLMVSDSVHGRKAQAAGPPDIVVILTDDQVADTTQYMPNVTQMLTDKGTTFTNNFDNNPWCCPARATIMTGQTSGHNGIWEVPNSDIGGFRGWRTKRSDGTRPSDQTIFDWLHKDGYRTALIGKFLNGYKQADIPYVQQNVDVWDAFMLDGVKTAGCNPQGYWATCYSHNGTVEKHGGNEYSSDTSGAKAVNFINSTPSNQPLFMYYAPRAPHLPTLPEQKYQSACPALPSERGPGFNDAIIDGPAYMQRAALKGKMLTWMDDHWLMDCQALLSVDDQVANVVQALKDSGRLDNTLILYTSDNGYIFGAHRWRGKIVPYQASDQVPLIVRWDALGAQPGVASNLVTNMDYTATFLDAAGVSPPAGYQLDGQSLIPLAGGPGQWQQENAVLVEHSGTKGKVPPYCGVRTNDFLYAQYSTGEEELYDMNADQYQLTNVAGKGSYSGDLDQLRQQTHQMCDPLPPFFHFTH